MTKPQDEMRTRGAAECALDAEEHAIGRSESEADAEVAFEIAQMEILTMRRHLADVVEEGAINRRENLPTILGLKKQRVAIAEAKMTEPAQVVGTAKRGLKVERHFCIRIGLSHDRTRAQRQNAAIAHERHVLLQVNVHAVEREQIASGVIVAVIGECVAATTPWVAAR